MHNNPRALLKVVCPRAASGREHSLRLCSRRQVFKMSAKLSLYLRQNMEAVDAHGQTNDKLPPPFSLRCFTLELTAPQYDELSMLTRKPCAHPCCSVTEDVALRIISELHRGFRSVANVGRYGRACQIQLPCWRETSLCRCCLKKTRPGTGLCMYGVFPSGCRQR